MEAPQLVSFPATRFACIATHCEASALSTVIPPTIQTVKNAIGTSFTGPPRVYYVAWTEMKGEIWIGFPVTQDFDGAEGVELKDIEGGQAWKVTFDGPYSEMRVAWDALISHLNACPHQAAGLTWEDYVSMKPVTDIYAKVKA